MKKSIFLFFAAILCAIGASAKTIYLNAGGSGLWDQAGALFVAEISGSKYSMTKVTGSYYETDVPDAATTVKFLRNDPTTGNTWNNTENLTIPDGKNCYTITGWSYGDWSTYTYDPLATDVFLAGQMNGWSTTANEFRKANAGDANGTISMILEAGSYELKVVRNGTWTGHKGTFSSSVSGKTFSSGVSDNAKMTTTIHGEYTFTWAISSSQLSITYPTLCTITANANDVAMGSVTGAGEFGTGLTATLTAITNDGYVFVNWTKGGEIVSTDATYSFKVTETVDLVANFEEAAEEVHNVTISYLCNETTVKENGIVAVGVTTTQEVTAPTVTGYNFTGWTIGAGITLKAGTASDATITVVTKSASSDYTLVANYEEVMETVYFINTNKWARVNIHKWNGKAANSSWPGENLTASGEKIGGYDVYSYTAKQGDYANVIFNSKTSSTDGGNAQTDDLDWTAGKYYIHNYKGTKDWKTYDEAVALLATAPDYFITGTLAGGWTANEIKMTYDEVTETYSHTFTSVAANAEQKIKVTDGTWSNSWGGAAVSPAIDGITPDGDDNVCFTLKTAGDVTITFKDSKIQVTTTGEFKVPVVYPYYILGTMNSWSVKEEYGLADEDADGVYTREITLAAGEHFFKINIGKWDQQWGWTHVTGEYKEVQNANDDNKIKIVLDAEKTFTVKLDPTNNKISFAGLTRPGRYLTGNDAVFGYTDGNWTPNTIQMTWDEVNGIYTYTTPTLNANQNYIFRVTNGAWDGKWGYDNLDPVPDNVLSFGDDKNICFMLAAEGTITVTMNGDKLGLTTTSSFAAPVYTLVGDAAITGCHWDVNSAENQMVQDATDKNKYTLVKTVTAVAGDYDYKAIRNHSYEWEVKGDKLNIEKEGTGTITYTLDIATPKLTAEVSDWVEGSVAKDVKLVGIGEDKEFTEAADHLTTSVDVVLEANSVYSFNIILNGVYLKNNGVMWRENCTGWTFNSEGDKAHIITDLAGTYTFTWTYEGNKLSVTYPDGTNVPAPVFLAGEMNGWDRLATRLIPSADGTTASATITLNRNEKSNFRMVVGTEDWTNPGEMKRTNCTGWTFVKVTESNKDVNASILPDYTDEYTFTWTYAENKLSVTYPTEECTDCSGYYLVGEMNGWNQIKDEFMKAEGTAIEVSLELTAGSYEFKIKNGDDWYSDEDLTVTRSNSTSIAFDMKDGGNTHFTADIDGVYTFTYTTDQKELTVQYPTPTITLTTGNNDDVIAANIGKTVNVKIERSFTANDGYYTLCVPFNMDPSVIGKAYSLGTITEHVAGEGININLEEETYMLSAGVPYLVLPKANMSELVVENVTIQSVEATGQNITKEELNVQIFFQGYYSASGQTDGSTEYYVGEHGYLYNEVVDIRGLCGLFTITDTETNPINIRARVVTREDEATGFENITNGENTVIKVIENGQLVIICNGEKFNAQGQKL